MAQREPVELARSGDREASSQTPGNMAQLVIPIAGGKSLLIGLQTAGMPDSPSDSDLVRRVATFIGFWLAQQPSGAALEHQPRDVQSEDMTVRQSLGCTPPIDDRLDVFALGTLRAERGGIPIRSWGGPKAGTRQAEGIFAFLFDRGERGAHKDEIIELIWPDVSLGRGDLAFHRTIGGLRRTLSPLRRAKVGETISFHNDRYRLNSDLIRWSDVREFEGQLDAASIASESEAIRQHLETARLLYRGDYLDDCPFFGDSSDVEERRQLLRGRRTDVLLALADAHELCGNRTAAVSFFREALTGNGNDCPPAEQGLMRLHLVAPRMAITSPEPNPGDGGWRTRGLRGQHLGGRASDRWPIHRLGRHRRAIGPQSRRRTNHRESPA
jgi:DNA-binding SARP family transcriptional activator